MTEYIHTCNYECLRPACVLSQRNELVKRLEQPEKEWVELTYEERKQVFEIMATWGWLDFSRAIEKILKDKNT